MAKSTGIPNDLKISRESEPGTMTETEAIRLAQEGNAGGFERLYQLHSGRVFCLCLRMTNDPAEAEDLTQEAFLQLFRKIHTFRGESKLYTWLHRLTVNIALMKFRQKRPIEISLDEPAQTGSNETKPLIEPGAPDPQLSGLLDRVNLKKAVDQLPHGYREVFILHDVEGYGHGEIAEILGFSIGNSKSQLFKARVRLRSLLFETLRSHAREKRLEQEAAESVLEEPHADALVGNRN